MSIPNEPDTDFNPYVLLLTNDDAGLTGFRGDLLPNDRVLIKDLPVERLDGICPGEVLVIPPPGSSGGVLRVRPTGTKAFRETADSPTVVAVVILASPVAHIPLPDTLTAPAFQDLVAERGGDVIAALRDGGVTCTALTAEQLAKSRKAQHQPDRCTPPKITVVGPGRGDYPSPLPPGEFLWWGDPCPPLGWWC